MAACRIHIMGASGAGVTTLGRATANALGISHHDTDDYFWRPTTPPYLEQRSVADRLRLMRLRDRKARHFGADAVSPGGWRHQDTEEFIEWASHYDDGSREGRSLIRHEAWLATLNCRVLRADGTRTPDALVGEIVHALGETS